MTGRASANPAAGMVQRLNNTLGRLLPERRVFIRSETDTRFIRLQPLTQAIGLGGGALVIGWAILSSAILAMDEIGSGNLRDQTLRDQRLYEARLNQVSAERDARATEVTRAYERYNFALRQISEMQSALLESEDRRQELETGIEVIQTTLRRTMHQRDQARGTIADLTTKLAGTPDSQGPAGDRADDITQTLTILSDALSATSAERDTMVRTAQAAMAEADRIALDKRLLEERNALIFGKLEEAVSVSMEPLDKMFRAAGLSTDAVLDEVKRGYSGVGGPLTPLSMSTRGAPAAEPSEDEVRAQQILMRLDTMNMYRIAAEKAPFARPTHSSVRFTSGFGTRRDPITGGHRRHNGLDFAGPRGTPILATGDGVVTEAGWHSGYGQAVTIRHAFGIETLYAHLSKIRVKKGQRVSRRDRIGDMGSTGRSTGTHLHYEVHVGNKPVNPMTYVRAGQDVF